MVLYYSSRHRVARRFPPTEDFQGLPDCVGQAPCLTSRAKVVRHPKGLCTGLMLRADAAKVVRHPKGLCTGLMLRADASVFAKATPDKRLVGQGATTYYLTIFFARRYFIPIGQKKGASEEAPFITPRGAELTPAPCGDGGKRPAWPHPARTAPSSPAQEQAGPDRAKAPHRTVTL